MEPELGRNDTEDLKFIKSLLKEGKVKEFEWVDFILTHKIGSR